MRYQPTAFARMVRDRCTRCRGRLRWYPLGEAFDVLGTECVNELLGFAAAGSLDLTELDFWRCRHCSEVGLIASPA